MHFVCDKVNDHNIFSHDYVTIKDKTWLKYFLSLFSLIFKKFCLTIIIKEEKKKISNLI